MKRLLAMLFGGGGDQVSKLAGSTPSEYRAAGDTARDAGDWKQAARSYELHCQQYPQDFDIWVQLGHVLKEAGQYAKAAEAYQAARALQPGNGDLLLNIGHLEKLRGNPETAFASYLESYAADRNEFARTELETASRAAATLGKGDKEKKGAARARPPQKATGRLEVARRGIVSGWAIDQDNRSEPARIELLADGEVVARLVADGERNDLLHDHGVSHAGFATFLELDPARGHRIEARLERNGLEIDNSPLAMPAFTHPAGSSGSSGEARFVVVKDMDGQGGEWALIVSHAPTGMLKPHVVPYIRALKAADLKVALIMQADRPSIVSEEALALSDVVVVRENLGYDFGAWADTLRLFPALFTARRLILTNDSLFGPASEKSLQAVVDRIRASETEVISLTETLERGWHLQSYFLAMSERVIASHAFQQFMRGIEYLSDKDKVIDRYEVQFSRRMLDAGFSTEALFAVDEARNPTLFAATRLVDAGFPFVKMLLLRGEFPHIKTSNLRHKLRVAGFDMKLLGNSLAYETDEPRPGGDWPLLARPHGQAKVQETNGSGPLKVSFYGPWNYDNGLGSASRAIIGAIRRTGVMLNLHPVKMPFHVHTALGPPHDVREFSGDPDVAIIHLNPDSWHLLTDEQRAAIARARKRIGYWVWEMEHIPVSWRQNFSSVDRIWAPSAYCAETFAKAGEAKVDVIPHPVSASSVTLDPAARADVLEAAGVAPDSKVILYVFDGSSYLVRKNPHALVRAFSASGLAARGWTLLLKCKHLNDRKADGEALASLANGTEGVVLYEANASLSELARLVAACDIYASPHASEGFGLTVAEAMAMGKPVVATNYGGTRQFLDDSVGYPVQADPYVLAEDFGHYTRGGRWAKIDEVSLANRLVEVAGAIEAGNEQKGQLARERVREMLSNEAVGKRVAASLRETVADKDAIWRREGRQHLGLRFGIKATEADFGSDIAVIAIGPDGLPTDRDKLEELLGDGSTRANWLVFAPEEGLLDPNLGALLTDFAAARPDAALIYADDIAQDGGLLADQLALKPEFDRWHFAATNYLGLPLIARTSALRQLGGMDFSRGDLAFDDVVLKAVSEGLTIAHLPDVALAWPGERREPASRDRRKKLVAASPAYAGYAVRDGIAETTIELYRRFDDGNSPPVTLLVPTCRSPFAPELRSEISPETHIERLLASLHATDWPMDKLRVLVADDIEGEPDWQQARWPFALTRMATPRGEGEPFNYSAKINRLWQASDTRHVVIMNDDVRVTNPGWLKALMTFAMDETVGGVGPRLLYENGTIQHAGVLLGPMGTCIHPWQGSRSDTSTYGNWSAVHRQWSAVTGAVFATRREVLETVNGLDETFSLEFNDIDLCLRIRLAGLSVICTPHAEMVHAEKASRGYDDPPSDQFAHFLERWSGWLANDPSYHPGMKMDTLVPDPAIPGPEWFRL